MKIISLPIGPLEANCYLIYEGQDALIIDPPSDMQEVVDILRAEKLNVHKILCTHLHFDHISGCKAFNDLTKAEILAGEDDRELLMGFTSGRGKNFGFPEVELFEYTALEEKNYKFGALDFQALHCPGHSPGSFCFYFASEELVITGDVLFRRSVGRTDLPGGNQAALLQSIRTKLFTLPEATVAYPGHGAETNIAYEKAHNPYC